jgi:hypothetical protein
LATCGQKRPGFAAKRLARTTASFSSAPIRPRRLAGGPRGFRSLDTFIASASLREVAITSPISKEKAHDQRRL